MRLKEDISKEETCVRRLHLDSKDNNMNIKDWSSYAVQRTGTHSDSYGYSAPERQDSAPHGKDYLDEMMDAKESSRSNKYVLSFRDEFSKSSYNNIGPRFSVPKNDIDEQQFKQSISDKIHGSAHMDDFDEPQTLENTSRDDSGNLQVPNIKNHLDQKVPTFKQTSSNSIIEH